ncbi:MULTISPECIES: glycosyltransferase family 9 protein [Pelosinus]|uniref:Glycosyl transferase family 9 n=1 Tax=Pelosinus fermentans B4 TaxID=1149862 RepID=I8REK0_9FIRM|nr:MULTISPECIES: glycosyltransferase family 9 protein [Pelosinus]EIW16015.1 glycosyl transferase family 9 [Pelosinus fermentans B4]EIW27279.1 glycosyl transferase family 9 [Pelosinus fermentans A11]
MKTFLVINTSFFGDVLLTDPLCRNIKLEYPNSKVIFMVNKSFAEVARYMDGVDEVLCYDKNGENKGLTGFFRFYNKYKVQYKNKIDVAFVIYGNERGIVLSKLFGAKKIYSDNTGLVRLFLDNRSIDYKGRTHTQDKHNTLLELYTGRASAPILMLYLPPREAVVPVDILWQKYNIKSDDKLVAVCTTTKRIEKDMPVAACAELIAGLIQQGKKVVYVGAGEAAVEYVKNLHILNCTDFVDLTNQTTITQLAEVLKRCKAAISVDTGTLHLICALEIPLLALFYVYTEDHLNSWAPKNLYPHRLMAGEELSVDEMLDAIKTMTDERKITDG